MRVLPVVLLAACLAFTARADLIINELDADQTGTDVAEFIEIFETTGGTVSLNGYVLTLWNGSNDLAYNSYDLDGLSTDANGFFSIGNAPGVTYSTGIPASNWLQNGADAVGLYLQASPHNVGVDSVTGVNLVSSLVYDTNDADDAGLLAALGGTQYNEDGGTDSTTDSLQFDGVSTFAAGPPTLNSENFNLIPEPSTLALLGFGLIALLGVRQRARR